LEKQFSQLSESAYFDPGFNEFLKKTIAAINHVLSNEGKYPELILKTFEGHLWRVQKFILGSRSNDAPYEITYSLKLALSQWVSGLPLVSNAAQDEMNFFLDYVDIWSFIDANLDDFNAHGYRPLMVRIGSPGLYKHRPVFCTPLFHELGHFVDIHHKISEVSILRYPPPSPDPSLGLSPQQYEQIVLNHRMEHFADLFASCYCSDTLNKSLEIIAGSQGMSATHPATSRRCEVVEKFLADEDHDIIKMFNDVLDVRQLPKLEKHFSIPDIEKNFDEALTYKIRDESELFGLLSAAWNYLENRLVDRNAAWISASITEFEIEKTINDLTEKSLRNYELKRRWEDADVDQE
jgi:hypothetical protein